MGNVAKTTGWFLLWFTLLPSFISLQLVENLSCRKDLTEKDWVGKCGAGAPCVLHAAIILPDNERYEKVLKKNIHELVFDVSKTCW